MATPDTNAEPDCEAVAAARVPASTCAAARTWAASTPSFNLATKDNRSARHAVADSDACSATASGSQMSGRGPPKLTAAPAKPGAATPTM